jgi:hypothetical protein
MFEIVSNHVADLVTVSDKSGMRALVEILETEKLLTEPASFCSVAALFEGRIRVTARWRAWPGFPSDDFSEHRGPGFRQINAVIASTAEGHQPAP